MNTPAHPLDPVLSPAHYGHCFVDLPLWQPFVRQVCAAHGLSCTDVAGTTPGTFPTFRVDRRWVVKFFGPLFAGLHCFEVERAVGQWLALHPQVPAAPLIAAGNLRPPGTAWEWPYLVYGYIAGESMGQVFARLSQAEKIAAAEQLGGWVRALHELPLPASGPFEPDWAGFCRFLAEQRASCAARQAAWGNLAPDLVAGLADFLPPGGEDWYLPGVHPHLIHADLTADHLFGRADISGWQACALIDFGDARTGSLEYELAALQLSLFQGDRRLLAAFLAAYGFTPPPGFAQRALAFCLLHQFDVLSEQPATVQSANSLPQLAERLFGV